MPEQRPTTDGVPSAAPGGLQRTGLDRVGESLALVERVMRDQLASEGDAVAQIGAHVLGSGGKRMRPALLLLAAELCGYTGSRRVPIAAAVELLHTATLLHDDVIDLSELRRGRPSANAIWGNRRAVLVGDFFYARASAMIVEDGDLDVLWIFSNTIRRMAEGELLQMQGSFDANVTEAQYYAVIERKSADLLCAACESGAILGGVTRGERRRVAEYGRELGLAFQLRDDALDYSAGAEVLGKAPYTDVCEGKVTLPLLLALKRCTTNEREAASAVLKTAARRTAELEARGHGEAGSGQVLDADDLAPVLEIIARHRGVEDTNRRAGEHAARAAASIAAFPDSPAKQALVEASEFAVVRES